MTAVVLLVSALLAAVAAAGVLRPILRPAASPPDLVAEPPARPERPAEGLPPRRGVAPVSLVAGAILLALVGVLLAGSLRDRAAEEPITGVGSESPIELFERRVREHPQDLAARLDLADRYLAAGETRAAIEQYTAALEIDPGNPEALARLGFLLFRAGRPQEGLAAVDRALAGDAAYPEALYFRGVILLRGLDRPAEARQALRDYLAAAPFGAYRDQAGELLAEAREQSRSLGAGVVG